MYLFGSDVDVCELEKSLDNLRISFGANVSKRDKHHAGVTSLVGLVDVANFRVQQDRHDVEIAVRYSIVHCCVTLNRTIYVMS